MEYSSQYCTAVQIMSYIVADGKSNWLEGAILICPLFFSFSGLLTTADTNAIPQAFTLISL
jgi:hypothetical protein